MFSTILRVLTVSGSMACAAAWAQTASPSAKPGADDKPVMSRRLVIGTSNRVHQLLQENPQAYQFRRVANDIRVDERAAPNSCGLPLAKYFREQIVSTFSVATTNDCQMSSDKVACQSHYLPGYSRTYLSLSYSWRPAEVDLVLAIRQSGLWGEVKNPSLAGQHVDWMEGVFDCLVSIAECGPAPPQCAVKR
jgi:hypothetical protein